MTAVLRPSRTFNGSDDDPESCRYFYFRVNASPAARWPMFGGDMAQSRVLAMRKLWPSIATIQWSE